MCLIAAALLAATVIIYRGVLYDTRHEHEYGLDSIFVSSYVCMFCNATRDADSLAQIARQGRRQRRRHVAVGRCAAGPDREKIEGQARNSRRKLRGKWVRVRKRERKGNRGEGGEEEVGR